MPFRSQETLQAWLDEFEAMGFSIAGTVKVMPHDGGEGENTGLVGVRLSNASTTTYIQPDGPGSCRWVVTMEEREDPVVLDSAGVHSLAAELSMVSALCAFLQAKSAELKASSAG